MLRTHRNNWRVLKFSTFDELFDLFVVLQRLFFRNKINLILNDNHFFKTDDLQGLQMLSCLRLRTFLGCGDKQAAAAGSGTPEIPPKTDTENPDGEEPAAEVGCGDNAEDNCGGEQTITPEDEEPEIEPDSDTEEITTEEPAAEVGCGDNELNNHTNSGELAALSEAGGSPHLDAIALLERRNELIREGINGPMQIDILMADVPGFAHFVERAMKKTGSPRLSAAEWVISQVLDTKASNA